MSKPKHHTHNPAPTMAQLPNNQHLPATTHDPASTQAPATPSQPAHNQHRDHDTSEAPWQAQAWLHTQLQQALTQHSSDLHLSSQAHGWQLQRRTHGILQHLATLSKAQGQAVLACLKVKAQLDITEHRRPQEGRFELMHQQQRMHARLATCPCFWGESASIRLLYGSQHLRHLQQLGMHHKQQQQFKQALQQPHGLILACGPTGSGKSQTLNVAIQSLAQQGKHCLSLEDPVEMPIPDVNHIQINPALGLSYAQGLKTCLRMDPDVILIGEIRDHDTAQLAVHAAQSGHLILGTVHSPDAVTLFDRMHQLGVPSTTLAPLCRLIINQRLIAMLCPHCKQAMPTTCRTYTPHRTAGCSQCHQGTTGRRGLFELWSPPEHAPSIATLRLHYQQADITPIQAQAQTLWQQGLCEQVNVSIDQPYEQ